MTELNTRCLAIALVASFVAGDVLAQDGEAAFRRRCASCHALEEGVNRAGPSLAGIFGRTAGSLEGARYTPAMRDADFIWDDSTLDAFLTAPRDVVPRTSMTAALRNAGERADIIAFLRGAP